MDFEVHGLFADLIPAEATRDGGELQWGRARQGKIPDLRFRKPTPNGPIDSLAEIKFVTAGVSWFPRGVQGKGTEKRAALIPGEYKKKLADMDRLYHGTTVNQTGPLVERLQSFGTLETLVIGPWGEGSRGVHELIKVIGENKVKSRERSRGVPASDNMLGVEIGQIRRTLSTAFVRANSVCLLSRISYLGKNGEKAGQRRTQMLRMEEERRQERQAHYLAHVKSRGISRVGQLFV